MNNCLCIGASNLPLHAYLANSTAGVKVTPDPQQKAARRYACVLTDLRRKFGYFGVRQTLRYNGQTDRDAGDKVSLKLFESTSSHTVHILTCT
jgi:hypothetical protein